MGGRKRGLVGIDSQEKTTFFWCEREEREERERKLTFRRFPIPLPWMSANKFNRAGGALEPADEGGGGGGGGGGAELPAGGGGGGGGAGGGAKNQTRVSINSK